MIANELVVFLPRKRMDYASPRTWRHAAACILYHAERRYGDTLHERLVEWLTDPDFARTAVLFGEAVLRGWSAYAAEPRQRRALALERIALAVGPGGAALVAEVKRQIGRVVA